MGDERGDVDGRRVQKGPAEREQQLEEQQQVSQQEGALTWCHHGDGKHCRK